MYDYLIIGAGSAGCVLANRLSADSKNRVCLVEAGGSDKNPLISTPLGITTTAAGGLYNWKYNTIKQKTMNDRSIYCPRGKVFGGSSSINAMLYVRGQKQDYDSWVELGNKGWGYNDVLPYFKKSQNQERGQDLYHAVGGPLNVADLRNKHPLCNAVINAAIDSGEKFNDDFNGENQEGVGWFQATQKDGQRCSAAAAYLHPVLKYRSNLTVISNARTAKVLFEEKRAVGVEIIKDGQHKELRAQKEVILSAGAFGTPQILLLSGIGCEKKLSPHGIKQIHHLPGVGENLQEHVDVTIIAKDKTKTSWAPLLPLPFIRSAGELLRYIFKRKGMFSSVVTEAGGFIKVDDESLSPDIQLHIAPLAMGDHGRHLPYYWQHGISVHACVLRPKSRGQVSLASANPQIDPTIDLNLLSHEDDINLLTKAFQRMRGILSSPTLYQRLEQEITPGNEVESVNEIKSYIRKHANHIYHPVGTCKMGTDEMAVVDDELRVRGIENLRIVDASIMPSIISGNTNAPTIMIGEKAADMIIASNS